jgi:YD repeat-containing protein
MMVVADGLSTRPAALVQTAWVNLAGNLSANQDVVAQQAGTSSGFSLKYVPGSGSGSGGYWSFIRPLADADNPATASANASPTAPTGNWTFLTGTYDASTGTMTLYVNGAAAGTATDTTPIPSHGPLTIGQDHWNGAAGDFFDGQIAGVQAYARALPASQVQALYSDGHTGGDSTFAGESVTTTWTRDQRGLPTSMTDPDGNITRYSYDEALSDDGVREVFQVVSSATALATERDAAESQGPDPDPRGALRRAASQSRHRAHPLPRPYSLGRAAAHRPAGGNASSPH